MSDAVLDAFGRLIVERVRDQSIFEWDSIINGHMKGQTAELARQRLSAFDPEHISVLKVLLPEIVDTVLHHFMWTFEQDESLDIVVSSDAGDMASLKLDCDGLAGDLVGWIPRYSKERYDTLQNP